METIGSSEIFSLIYQITRRHISQDGNPRDNLICYNDTLWELSLIFPEDGSSWCLRNISVSVRPKKFKDQIQTCYDTGLRIVLSELDSRFPSKLYHLPSILRVHDVTFQKSVT
jgi:hypothetical protein